MRIVEDKKYKNMYRLDWEDGTRSVSSQDPKPWAKGGHYGIYNKTRAKDLMKREGIENYTLGVTYDAPMARLEARG